MTDPFEPTPSLTPMKWERAGELRRHVDAPPPPGPPHGPLHVAQIVVFGAGIKDRRQLLWNRSGWRLQLNVHNVLDQHWLCPLIDADSRDGRHTPATAVHTLKEPRAFRITSALPF